MASNHNNEEAAITKNEIQLTSSLIVTKLIDENDQNNDNTADTTLVWPCPPQCWRSAAYPARLHGRHRFHPQPYDETNCTWQVDPGPCCHVWKWPSSLSKQSDHRKMMIAHYRWDHSSTTSTKTTRAALLMLHGLGSHTMFQFLQRADNGERHHRGLFYKGSFIEQCQTQLSSDEDGSIVCYGLDMEGHGYSFVVDDNDNNNINNEKGKKHKKCSSAPVLWMQQGVRGVIQDIQRLLEYIRQQHDWDDYSRIFLIGHSTGCLALTRAVQELEVEEARHDTYNKPSRIRSVGGLICTAPLFGQANVDGSESVSSQYGTHWLMTGLASSVLTTLNLLPHPTEHPFVLSTAYTTQADDARDNSSVHPAVVQKSISPGCFIETWVSGDRDLDPLFHSPYTPIYPVLARSIVQEVRTVHRLASTTLQHCPLLVVHSPYDPVVSYDASRRFVANCVKCPDKELYTPPDDCHMLHNVMLEQEGRDIVNQKILEWIQQRLPPP
ncbi:hypothetical protein ACA910_017911 [Epithemia clementina (nom. ined.)]